MKRKTDVADDGPQAKRTKCPGVRVLGGRIYDSKNGRTCHQCRQKTRDFSASCKNLNGQKQCPINFCHRCLLVRYGEKAEEMAMLDDWKCPRCRGICNCSFCMKKRGHRPTGILAHTAKATGFSSVSEFLGVKGLDYAVHDQIVKDTVVSPKKPGTPKKGPIVASPKKPGKENAFDGKDNSSLNSHISPTCLEKKSGKRRGEGLQEVSNSNKDGDVSSVKKSSLKKPKTSEKVSVPIGSKKPKISKKLTKEEVKTNERDTGKFPKKKKSKAQVLKNSSFYPSDEGKHSADSTDSEVPNGVNIGDNTGAPHKTAVGFCKPKECIRELLNKELDAETQMPQGTTLMTISGLDLPTDSIGHALQFLEFCAAFGGILDLKKGQAESVIRDMIFGRSRRQSQYSSVVQIHTQLLSLIQEDEGKGFPSLSPATGKNSWLSALGKCVSESQCVKEFSSDYFGRSGDTYNKLEISEKLKLLNFLCDEALNTTALRNWIDEEISKFFEKEKGAKGKVFAAKDKEKKLKQKLQDEVAKAIIARNGAPLSISEHEKIVSKIKSKAAQAHAEMLEAMGMVPQQKQRSDAVRTEPVLLDLKGRAFWKLKCYTGEPEILLQDMGAWDAVAPNEKWFRFDSKQKEAIKEYISSIREKKRRIQKLNDKLLTKTKHGCADDIRCLTSKIEVV